MPTMSTTATMNGEQQAVGKADVCPICGSSSFEPLFQVPFPYHTKFEGKGFPLDFKLEVPAWRIVHCNGCSVCYPNPLPTRESINHYYADQQEPSDWEMENYVNISQKGKDSWAKFVRNLTILNGGPGALLEIGCAAGWVLHAARDQGWDANGVEASPKFQKHAANKLNLPVRLGTLEDIDFGEKKFDVVMSTDVFEHLYDPIGELQRIRKIMKPDGHLVMATCDIGSACAKFWGLGWRQLVISHTFYWTRKSMTLVLERAGFKVESFSEPRYWHPVWSTQLVQHAREIVKLLVRIVLRKTYVPLGNRFGWVRSLIKTLSGGKLDHEGMLYRIGDQPVLGDVMLVVARPV